MQVERVADTSCETGEGPLWHPDEHCLYWVDIPPGKLHRYNPGTDEHELVYETPDGSPIGGFTIEANGSLLLFGGGGRISRWDPRNEAEAAETVVDSVAGEAGSRFNDIVADPEGRVFAGTMPTDDHLGTLYRLDTDRTVTPVVEEVDIPNGMGFTLDRTTFYFTESEARRIYAFDYERATGGLSNRRTFVEVPEGDGVPDGLTVDSEGYVWSARWDGNRLVRYTPSGTVDREIEFPARKVSSVTFGGEELRDLYVTTANVEGRDAEGDGAGALFRVPDVGVSGKAEFRSEIA
ncbi:SMP-30/gluconolactonase/LRE family protein [Halorussus salinisoli]|uniref:SMP-30/gluconolactonase/LRE family protein n=1 Tax=Halorussus salinisoli TaxID=2558242 RepID=UPI0010C1A242|nr:SMP-30/gluconolactonase/LRE family protein [Halorussus salinisoli]